MIHPVQWRNGAVVLLDQRLLPTQEVYRVYRQHRDVARAIRDMVVRGAPAIGVTAAMGIALGMRNAASDSLGRTFEQLCRTFAATRPTAVNLFWAIDRMKRVFSEKVLAGASVEDLRDQMLGEAQAIHDEDVASCRAIGRFGGALVPENAGILTHCNAGALATAGYGTALGVIRGAIEQGRSVSVFADETRPVLQGARLTAWELVRDGIDTTVISDNMAAVLMRQGRINFIVVGADRIAANGDAANKIGTYTVAVLAKEHGVPFYVAAPLSTIDLATPDGSHIPIEQRPSREMTHVGATRIVPDGADVWNPAFDVTPARLVSGIITEKGIARAPYGETLKALFHQP
jgi:methylthioribose-1-phosphate isomerase